MAIEAEALLERVIDEAKAAGADAADAVMAEGISLSASWRLGQAEDLERSEAQDLGLRVLIGKQQAIVSTSDHSPPGLAGLAERAVAMAKLVPEDPYCGLADAAQLAKSWPDLDLADDTEPSADDLVARARAAEDAARAVDGITNSEGGAASWGRSRATLATSTGFMGGYATTRFTVSASVLAGEGTEMERDYDWDLACFEADLDDAAKVGTQAGERTIRRLNPRKAQSGQVPVVYDPRVSGGLLRHFSGAISGAAIARGTSFLKDQMDKPVFAEGITVIDDPHRERGLRSRPFDGEGIATSKREFVQAGVLQSWVLDCRSARQLGLETTGHAARGTSGPPSPSSSNLYIAAGDVTPDALIADISSGFYVTELIGMGVNGVTGDYSRGASGFWIENGAITYPVSELTIAGNLKDMFRHVTPANDLEFRFGVDAPTLRVEGMTVAGQ